MTLMVPMSPGDLLDRIAILEVKIARIRGRVAQANVRRELLMLRGARDASPLRWQLMMARIARLRLIHEKQWNLENEMRVLIRTQSTDRQLLKVCLALVQANAERAAVKREVNDAFGSDIHEEKDYADYRDDFGPID